MNEHLLKRNEERFEKLNIFKWHEARISGKGIKIGIIGYSPNSHHNGAWLINQVALDAEIIEYNVMDKDSYKYRWEEALQKALEDDISILCCSLKKLSWPDKLEELSKKLYDKGVIMIDSADNDNKKINAWPAKSKYWFVSGSYSEKYEDRLRHSNFGEKLDFLMYTSFVSKNRYGDYIPISHTSGTTQVPCGMVAILKEFYGKENFGQKEFEKYLKEYCIDLQEEGKDLDTGYGLLVLPKKLPKKEVVEMNKPCKIILHHSLTNDGQVKDFDAIQRYHIEKNGWRDIGYHYIIENINGTYKILKGRDEKAIGAHTKGENANSIGICLVGNFDVDIVPKEQLKKLVELIKDIRNRYGNLPIYGHCDYSSKSCPGTKFPWKEFGRLMEDNKYLNDLSKWAEDGYNFAKENEISDGTRPKDNITREEMWTMLHRYHEKYGK